MAEEKKKEEPKAKLVEVATQMGEAVELPDGTQVGTMELLIEIYNKVDRIEKSVA